MSACACGWPDLPGAPAAGRQARHVAGGYDRPADAMHGFGCVWRCRACGHDLATTTDYAAPYVVVQGGRNSLPKPGHVVLDRGLVALGTRDGMKAFGPSDRVRLHGRDPRASGTVIDQDHALPLFVYCPMRGCGVGQHLH